MAEKIILADDNQDNLYLTSLILQKEGYEVTACTSSKEAIEVALGQQPDLILMSVSLSSENDFEACKLLKTDPNAYDVPLILLSGGHVHMKKMVAGMEACVDGYLTLPLDERELLAKVRAFLRLKNYQTELKRKNKLLRAKEEELIERNQELEALFQLTQSLTRSLDLKEIFQSLFLKVVQFLKVQKCFLELITPDKEVAGFYGYGIDVKDWRQKKRDFRGKNSALAQVIKDKKPIFIPNAKKSSLVDKIFAYHYNLKSTLFIPLLSLEELEGILLICRNEARSFSEKEKKLAQIFCDEASFAIQRGRLFEEVRDMQKTLKAIIEWGDSGILMVDKKSIIRTANHRFGELFQVDSSALIGRFRDEVTELVMHLFKNPEEFASRLSSLYEHAEEVATDELEMVRPCHRVLQRFSGPVFDKKGSVMGRIEIYHDITDKKHSEKRMRGLYRRERRIAQILQKNLLPQTVPNIRGFQFGQKYASAVEGMVIGGDYYDFVSLSKDSLVVALGDVCGKGMSAAVRTYLVKYSLRAFARENSEPATVLSRLNFTFFQEMEEGAFVTLVYALVNSKTRELKYSIAGHPAPIIYHEGEGCKALEATGGVIGVIPGVKYEGESIALSTGDVVVFYTDGIIEARNRKNEFFGQSGLEKAIETSCGKNEDAQEIANDIFVDVLRFASERLTDDAALVVLKTI